MRRRLIGHRNDPVYRAVDARSAGRCEVCRRLATEHHHTRKPRGAFHAPSWVVHLCARCHDQAEAPFATGRLVFTEQPFGIDWVVLRGASKWTLNMDVLGKGVIALPVEDQEPPDVLAITPRRTTLKFPAGRPARRLPPRTPFVERSTPWT